MKDLIVTGTEFICYHRSKRKQWLFQGGHGYAGTGCERRFHYARKYVNHINVWYNIINNIENPGIKGEWLWKGRM